jgi:hypothetical protein
VRSASGSGLFGRGAQFGEIVLLPAGHCCDLEELVTLLGKRRTARVTRSRDIDGLSDDGAEREGRIDRDRRSGSDVDVRDAGFRILADHNARCNVRTAVVGTIFGYGKAFRSVASPVMTFS